MFTLPQPIVASEFIQDRFLKALRDAQHMSDDPDTQMTAIILSKCKKKENHQSQRRSTWRS